MPKNATIFEVHLNPVILVLIGKLSSSTLRWVPICQGSSDFSGFLHYFVLAKLATSIIRVKEEMKSGLRQLGQPLYSEPWLVWATSTETTITTTTTTASAAPPETHLFLKPASPSQPSETQPRTAYQTYLINSRPHNKCRRLLWQLFEREG